MPLATRAPIEESMNATRRPSALFVCIRYLDTLFYITFNGGVANMLACLLAALVVVREIDGGFRSVAHCSDSFMGLEQNRLQRILYIGT